MQLAIPPTATDIAKLKALEVEQHRLTANGQSNEAAEVQELYMWKLKQINGSKVSGSTGKESTCSNATEKYKDCLAINPSHVEANYMMGRSMLAEGDASAAIIHFKRALAIKPTYSLATSFLGMAMVHPIITNYTNEVVNEAIAYLESSNKTFRHAIWYKLFKLSKRLFGLPVKTDIMSHDLSSITSSVAVSHFLALSRAYLLASRYKESESILLDLLHFLPQSLMRVPKKGEAFRSLAQLFCVTQCRLYDISYYHSAPESLRRFELLESNLLALIGIRELTQDHIAFTAIGAK
jgi:tetratricopeptide (TPR) repeat protein